MSKTRIDIKPLFFETGVSMDTTFQSIDLEELNIEPAIIMDDKKIIDMIFKQKDNIMALLQNEYPEEFI